jgi:hypothetical protein
MTVTSGGISFRHCFGSALNHHVHLHACVTDGVFVPAADHAGCDAPPTFLLARPATAADLAALTERVRRRVIRWFRLARLLDAAASPVSSASPLSVFAGRQRRPWYEPRACGRRARLRPQRDSQCRGDRAQSRHAGRDRLSRSDGPTSVPDP